MKQKKYDEAIKLLDEAVMLNPKNAWAWNDKGTAHYCQGNYDEALRAYIEATKIGSFHRQTRKLYNENKAAALTKLGRLADAAKLLELAATDGVPMWYNDDSKLTHIAVYDDVKKASDEANIAARKGWLPQGTSTTAGQISAGGIIAGDLLFGGLGALAVSGRGATKSRSPT